MSKVFSFTQVVNNSMNGLGRTILRRDTTRFDQGTQLQAIKRNVDKLTKRIVKAAKAGDTNRVQHLSVMLANSKGKAMFLIDQMERLSNTDT